MENIDYKSSKQFIKDQEVYLSLAIKISDLSIEVEKLPASLAKLDKLNTLFSYVNEFNSHVNKMIKEFPNYYKDYKFVLDNLFDSNKLLANSIDKQIITLKQSLYKVLN